jgi:hypothetical protein
MQTNCKLDGISLILCIREGFLLRTEFQAARQRKLTGLFRVLQVERFFFQFKTNIIKVV